MLLNRMCSNCPPCSYYLAAATCAISPGNKIHEAMASYLFWTGYETVSVATD